MFPDIALLTSGFGILQKILSIRVLLLLDVLVGRYSFCKSTKTSQPIFPLSRAVLIFSATLIKV